MSFRTITVLALLVVLLAIIAIMWPSDPVPGPVNIRFLAFTNTSSGPEAIFFLSPLPEAGLSLYSARRKEGDSTDSMGAFSWASGSPDGLHYAIGVLTTNEPLQVVFQIHHRSTGPKRIYERVLERIGEAIGRTQNYFTGRTVLLTNETRIARDSGELHVPSGPSHGP